MVGQGGDVPCCCQQRCDDQPEVGDRLRLSQVGLGIDHCARQHEDLVVQTVHVTSRHDQFVLIHAVAG